MSSKELHDHLSRLRSVDPKLEVTLNAEGTAVATLRGKLGRATRLTTLKRAPFDQARLFIKQNQALFGELDEAQALVNQRALTNRRNMTHVIFQQKHGEATVLGANLSIHYGVKGDIFLVKSSLAEKIDVSPQPHLQAEQAAGIATTRAGAGASLFEKHKPELLVVEARVVNKKPDPQHYFLCWRMRIDPPQGRPGEPLFYLVDAHSGEVLLTYPVFQTSGTGYYSTGTALNSEASGGSYRLRDATTSSGWAVGTKPVIHTYDDADSGSTSLRNYSTDSNNNWNNGGTTPAHRYDDQRAEVDLHRFLGYVISYYYTTHGHNSWDGAGVAVRAHAHNHYPGYMPNNAFWDPSSEEIYFGDGDGTTRDFFTVLDTTTHEFTHGVSYGFNILQTYSGETGALSEAVSDLFGAFVVHDHAADDPWPWHHGRQYRLDGTVGRNMIDPSRDTAGTVRYNSNSNATKEISCDDGWYPDHYSIRYTGGLDHGGVHWNAPIITHGVYLMINGGTHRLSNVAVAGIGVAPVEQMLFEVISTGLLTNTSTFADFRKAFIEACQTLYPDNLNYLASVKTAFHAIGVGPDLYIRDSLTDVGVEPGALSCMSPDIILRRQLADAATLTAIGDKNNGSLCEDIELGTTAHDHYVYFRIFNRGSTTGSGTLRVFISPASSFSAPTAWSEVGHYDFPSVAASGGMWKPTTNTQCITLSAALITTLGAGHFCFIGIIESPDDPPPDRNRIDDLAEFHDYIAKSNNYAWRNCNIVEVTAPETEDLIIERNFQLNGFGPRLVDRDLEVDTRELPEGVELMLWVPKARYFGLKARELVQPEPVVARPEIAITHAVIQPAMVAGETPIALTPMQPVAMANLAPAAHVTMLQPKDLTVRALNQLRSVKVGTKKVIWLAGLTPTRREKIPIRFVLRIPKGTPAGEIKLTFTERGPKGLLGQMNYVFRLRRR